jgi:hypothetical protein
VTPLATGTALGANGVGDVVGAFVAAVVGVPVG